jgi:uncharacterized protein YkwD
MNKRLKLTEAEIEQIIDEIRNDPPAPMVISIGDLEAPPGSPRVSAPLIRITEDDLAATPPQYGNAPNLVELETLMFGLINSARQAHLPRWMGGANLQWHERLAAVARGHSLDMLRRGYVDHTSPEGVKVAKRIDLERIGYVACGENIGVVYGAASHSDAGVYEIHKAFMNQPRRLTNHRGNLLNPIWSHVGIGAAYDERGTLVMTQNFIATLGQ